MHYHSFKWEHQVIKRHAQFLELCAYFVIGRVLLQCLVKHVLHASLRWWIIYILICNMVHWSLVTDVIATETSLSGLESGHQGLSNCRTSRYLTVYLTGICMIIILNADSILSKVMHNSSNYADTSSLVMFYCCVLPTNYVIIRRSYLPLSTNLQTTFANAFLSMKKVHRLNRHLSLFLRIQLIMNQHCFR